MGLDQAAGNLGRGGGVEGRQALAHLGVEDEGLGQALIDPGGDLAGGGGPAHGVGDVDLDLAHPLVAVGEHALVPLGVEHAGAGLDGHLLGQGAHHATAAGLVADIDRDVAALGAAHRPADATQGVEVVVDGGDAQFHRVQVLVGELDVGEDAGEQLRLAHQLAGPAEGEALAAGVGLRQFVLLVPAAAVHQVVDVGPVGAVGVGEDAQGGGLQVAALGGLVGQGVLAHEVELQRLLGAGRQPGGLRQHARLQGQQVAEDAGQGHDHVDPGPAQLLQGDEGGAGQAAEAVEARPRPHQG